MTDLELVGGVSAIPIILGLVQLAKMFGLKEKYAPLLAVVLGELFSLGLHFYSDRTWYIAVIGGLVIGLSSIGLYSGTRETVQAFRKTKKC